MTKFTYSAKNQVGQTVAGVLEAPDERSVFSMLRKQGLFVVDIKTSFSPFAFISSRFRKKISFSEIVNFTRQLAVMVSSGLTLTEALTAVRNQTTNRHFEKLLSEMLITVESGATFSQTLERYKDLFSPVYVAVIRSGETSGLLDKMLLRLADNLERERDLAGKTKNALLYPTIILIGVGIVITIMMVFVIPQLSTLYNQLSLELPLVTRIVVGLSNFLVSTWYIIVPLFVLAFILVSNWKKTPAGKHVYNMFLLQIPAWGTLEKDANLAELTRMLGVMVASGTPIITALNSIGGALHNSLYGEAILRSARKVEKGLSLATALSQERVFPPIIAQMARVGEETGKLDDVMLKVSVYFEGEVERRVKTLSSVIEPIILAVLGIIVGFLMISVLMPIYDLFQAF